MKKKILGGVFGILLVMSIFSAIGIADEKNDDFKIFARDIFYAYNAYDEGGMSEGPISFPSDDPGNVTLLAPTSSGDFIAGACWANGTWYGCEYSSSGSNSNIWTIDPSTGSMTLVGASGSTQTLNGLAYDPTTDTMYACGSTVLYTIDMNSGSASVVGAMGNAGVMIGIACDANGNLYGLDLADEGLYSINKTTGSATLIGSTGLSLNYAQDMAFDKDNNILYLAAFIYPIKGGATIELAPSGQRYFGGLYTCNVSDASVTLIGVFGVTEVTGFAIPYTLNSPPDTPVLPSGPTTVITGTEYSFSTNTTDPDGDDIYYMFDWGDGSNTTWLGPYPSGAIVTTNHSWNEAGIYNITVKAKDVNNAESEWSPSLQITAINMFTFYLFQGWNLITIPVENNYTASSLLADIPGCTIILKWNASVADFDLYAPGVPNDFPIEDGVGYLVGISSDTLFNVSGMPIESVAVPLYIGWNMLGWFNEEPVNASLIYTKILGCSIVLKWNASVADFDLYVPGASDFLINQGDGFLVAVNQESIWNGDP
ncbi:MAG TPA: PKD domain-containing protein [Thermoplasmatales archaeon]|nr:PKD domain-containing protein [Thermoplasmatales archaeon]